MKKGLSKIAMALFAAGLAFNVSAADIKVAVASDATSLDPQEQLSGQTLEMSHLVFDPLMRYTQDLQFEPRLAEKYERIDDKTVRFRKFRRNFVDKIVKNAVPQLRTLPACHTSSDVFVADMNNFRFDTFFVENIHHFMQSNSSIAVRLRASV